MDHNNEVPRYARWDALDRPGRAPCCWLDRLTGRLLFQPQGVDPNSAPVFVPGAHVETTRSR